MKQLDKATKIRLAAYLYGELHMKEQQIGWRLGGIPQPTVAALLKKARAQGLLEQCVVYRGEELSDGDNLLLETLQFQSELHDSIDSRLKAFGCKNLPRIYLYDLRADGVKDIPLEFRVQSFATCVAPELRALLTRRSVATIGVAWGGTIATVVAEMQHQLRQTRSAKRETRSANPITILAMCGEPLNDRPTQESSSAIAERLSEALNGKRIYAKTLGITPAYLPSRNHADGAEWIWRYIIATKPYVEVFGAERLPPDTRARVPTPEKPLCDSMDVFLTSVSIEGGASGYGNNKLYPSYVITPEELDSVAFGDLGGIPLPLPQLDEKQRGILKRLRESWTGITREQLVQCVQRGFEGHPTNRPPGCILVASGEQKARTVYQAVVKEQLVNHLFIDYECAEKLNCLLKGGSQD